MKLKFSVHSTPSGVRSFNQFSTVSPALSAARENRGRTSDVEASGCWAPPMMSPIGMSRGNHPFHTSTSTRCSIVEAYAPSG